MTPGVAFGAMRELLHAGNQRVSGARSQVVEVRHRDAGEQSIALVPERLPGPAQQHFGGRSGQRVVQAVRHGSVYGVDGRHRASGLRS